MRSSVGRRQPVRTVIGTFGSASPDAAGHTRAPFVHLRPFADAQTMTPAFGLPPDGLIGRIRGWLVRAVGRLAPKRSAAPRSGAQEPVPAPTPASSDAAAAAPLLVFGEFDAAAPSVTTVSLAPARAGHGREILLTAFAPTRARCAVLATIERFDGAALIDQDALLWRTLYGVCRRNGDVGTPVVTSPPTFILVTSALPQTLQRLAYGQLLAHVPNWWRVTAALEAHPRDAWARATTRFRFTSENVVAPLARTAALDRYLDQVMHPAIATQELAAIESAWEAAPESVFTKNGGATGSRIPWADVARHLDRMSVIRRVTLRP
jgi:hypothetical protein